MDNRRLNTGEVLMSGILYRPAPDFLIPDRSGFHQVGTDDEGTLTVERFRDLLEAGGIESSQYYGCWAICKADDGYVGELLQYRRRTEEFHCYSLDDAAVQAMKWYVSLG